MVQSFRSERAGSGRWILVVGAAGAVLLGWLASWLPLTFLLATVVGVVAHIALVLAAKRVAGRVLSVLFLATVLWLLYFPVRLLVIQGDRQNFTLHPVVNQASDGDLMWVWGVSFIGLGGMVLGGWLAQRARVGSPVVS